MPSLNDIGLVGTDWYVPPIELLNGGDDVRRCRVETSLTIIQSKIGLEPSNLSVL